jgi:hypothetical protein
LQLSCKCRGAEEAWAASLEEDSNREVMAAEVREVKEAEAEDQVGEEEVGSTD